MADTPAAPDTTPSMPSPGGPGSGTEPASVFASLDDYVAVPRVTGLALAPDGSKLVAPVQTLSPDRKRYVTSLWEIDPSGGPARRLTRSAPGESAPAWLPGGDLLFVSKRPDPDATEKAEPEQPALWLLPARGGEARQVASLPGGVNDVWAARDAGSVIVAGRVLLGPADRDGDHRKARKDADVTAVLWEDLPVRHWDHDLGPDHLRLFAADTSGPGPWALRDLTPDPGTALEDGVTDVSPDGSTVFTRWTRVGPGGDEQDQVIAIDVASGAHRVLAPADGPDEARDYGEPAVAPDGRWLAFVEWCRGDVEKAPTVTLRSVDLATGESRDLLPGFPLWPTGPVVAGDSSAVFFVADEAGHCPVWRVEVGTGRVTRLTAAGAYSDLCPSPDGRWVYALRSHVDSPSRPVRLDASGADQEPVFLDAPGEVGPLPGRVDEVETEASDGASVRAWLVLPAQHQTPAPLLLWVHGGPLMSWHGWSWRWNPWLMAARGWAVLLPDPGLSQGYGDGFVQRAWGNWGPVPFADLMAATDAACARADIDDTRTAAMGGSYGGYMANWIAGHTNRFKAIVTHASLWALDGFLGATDHPVSWAREWGYPDEQPELYERNSPHRHAGAITTPMLVVHGDRDYRVPIGEGLSLWTELVRRGVDAKFLYFPDEGHWVLKPGHAKVWYETVFAFLDHHVLGAPWSRPELV